MKPLTWFQERVGKKIRRDLMKRENIFARKLGYKPVVIADIDHAKYLFDIQNDLLADNGLDLNYRDL